MTKIKDLQYLRVEDIMKIENVSYGEAYRIFNEFEVRESMGIKFIDGVEFFKTRGYGLILQDIYYKNFEDELIYKVIELKPKYYNVNDIMEILKIGKKKAYEILDDCQNTFQHGKLKWVRAEDFDSYIDGLITATQKEKNRPKIRIYNAA